MQHLLQNYTDDVCLYVYDITHKQTILTQQKDKQIVSASLIKVYIMTCVLEEIRNNKFTLSTKIHIPQEYILDDSTIIKQPMDMTIYDLMKWMIIVSDNTATNALIRYVGMNTINNYIQQLQFPNTKLQRCMLDFESGLQNYTSQQDMCDMYSMLHHKEILNDDLCQVALDILSLQQDNQMILRYIDTPITFLHKTGELDYLLHDCGLLYVKDTCYYVGVSIYSDIIEGNYELMGQIGKKILAYCK